MVIAPGLERLWDWYIQTPEGWNGGGNWELYHDCGKGLRSHGNGFAASFYPNYNCLAGQAFGDAADLPNKTHPRVIAPDWNTYIVGLGYELFGGEFAAFENDVWFRRIANFDQEIPAPVYGPNPQPSPIARPEFNPWPNWNPGVSPIARPFPDASPWPFRWPRRPESPFRETGPKPSENPGPGRKPAPGALPHWRVEIRPQPTPDGRPTPRPAPIVSNPPFIPRKPPSRGEKEKKLRMPRGWGMALINAVTEGLDATRALWNSLPRKYRTPRADVNQRIVDLWNHWDQIDWYSAVRNLLENEIGDRFYGAIGRGMRGLGRGPWDGGYNQPQPRAEEYWSPFDWIGHDPG